jgi:hypothetical protein
VKAKLPINQKARFLEQHRIAKPIFWDSARRLNYLFWDNEKYLALAVAEDFSGLIV